MQKTLLIIDASIFLHRSLFVEEYGGDPVYTFWETVRLLKRITGVSHTIFTLDGTKRTFRHKMYLPYKAQRPEKTEEFKAFKDYIESEIKHKHLYEQNDQYESDDYVGSLATQFPGKVYIASADLDLSQLVDDRITMLKPIKNKYHPEKPVNPGFEIVDRSYVINRYGIFPEQIPHWKALAGDSSDNIKLPIKGLGDVAASKMLILYKDIEDIYKNLEDEDFPCPKLIKGLKEHREMVDLFLRLTTIKCDLECKTLKTLN